MNQLWEQGRPTRRQLIVDVVAALVYLLVVGGLYALNASYVATVPLVLGIGIALRRVSLVAVATCGVLAAVIQFANPGWHLQAVVADVAYAALFFVFGADPRPRVRWFAVGIGTVGLLALPGWLKTTDAIAGGSTPWATIGVVTAMALMVMGSGWVAGYLRLQRRRAIQAQLDAQVDLVERERMALEYQHEMQRSRVAADMHDIVAHSWAVVAAQADGARYTLGRDPQAAERALEVIAETARSTIADLRTILAELRDAGAEQPTPGAEQQLRLLERMRLTGMQIDATAEGDATASGLLNLTAYRLLSECLTNALKHGDLRHPVHVDQDWRDGYRLRVRNVIGTTGPGTGQGLVGMTERASIAGGDLHAGAQGRDWVVSAHVPPPDRPSTAARTDNAEPADLEVRR